MTARDDAIAVLRRRLALVVDALPEGQYVAIPVGEIVDEILDTVAADPLRLPRYRADEEEDASYRVGGGIAQNDQSLFAQLRTTRHGVGLIVATTADGFGAPVTGLIVADTVDVPSAPVAVLYGDPTATANARLFFLAGLAACDHADALTQAAPVDGGTDGR